MSKELTELKGILELGKREFELFKDRMHSMNSAQIDTVIKAFEAGVALVGELEKQKIALRDEFAIAAMQGIFSSYQEAIDVYQGGKGIAQEAYELADLMMLERQIKKHR